MEKNNKIYCDKCNIYLDNATNPEFNHSTGSNGEDECSNCKKSREQNYDDYVDPLNFYH